MQRKKIFHSALLLIVFSSMAFAGGQKEAPELLGVTTITEVLGDGQKIAAVALEYSEKMDSSKTTDEVEMTVDLLQKLTEDYSIDIDRIYNTGQSMGGMTSIALNIEYPDLFAASWLVACQWDTSVVAPMADKPLWIVVSEGDTKAHPGQEAITAVLVKLGATLTKDTWDAQSDLSLQEEHIAAMLKQDTSIYYTVFEGGTHQYTWQYAYYLEGIRDWLFAQHQ